MEIVYRRGEVTAQEVQTDLPERLSNSAVRTLLRILEEKGHLRHEERRQTYVYHPVVPKQRALRRAMQDLLHTFFDDSVEGAVAALLDVKRDRLTAEEIERLQKLIDEAGKEDR